MNSNTPVPRSKQPAVVLVPSDPLREHVEAIRAAAKSTLEGMVLIGHHLTEVQRIVGYGKWLQWLKENFPWSVQTAQNFIHLHRCVKESKNSQRVVNLTDFNLPMRALYALSAPSTPEQAREEILDRVESGEKVSYEQTKETIERHRDKPTHRPVSWARPEPTPKVNWDQINTAMKLIKEMDPDTWERFDQTYSKAKYNLGRTISF